MGKRDKNTMMNLILDVASRDENIRAVIMNGSRTSPSAPKDEFQDYDIVYVVNDVEPYVENRQWLKQFGELIMMQTPEEMDGIWPKSKDLFGFLMLFTDCNRIDLRLIQLNKFMSMPRDSQTIVLLDKDTRLEKRVPSDNDYLPHQPTEKEFCDCCNELLWVSTNVAKGIARKQLTYAKYMSEQIVKEQLIKLLTWYASIKTHFQKSIGAYAKYLEQYLEPKLWNQFCKTYVDADYDHMWDGLFTMHDIFHEIAQKIAQQYQFQFNIEESLGVLHYLKKIKDNQF